MSTTSWIDSSFAVEWLLGRDRARGYSLDPAQIATLPAQYAEICVFFLRRDESFSIEALASLSIEAHTEAELLEAARLWLRARNAGNKASLADAILAAVVRTRGGVLFSFDRDFQHLGLFRERGAIWSA